MAGIGKRNSFRRITVMIQGMQNNEEEMAKKELSKKVEWIKL